LISAHLIIFCDIIRRKKKIEKNKKKKMVFAGVRLT